MKVADNLWVRKLKATTTDNFSNAFSTMCSKCGLIFEQLQAFSAMTEWKRNDHADRWKTVLLFVLSHKMEFRNLASSYLAGVFRKRPNMALRYATA
jgi:hypothetical protein